MLVRAHHQQVGNSALHRVGLTRMFAIAQKSGYRGYYCMEPELPGDPLVNAAELIRQTMRFLS